jgi:hypothetical protein
MRLYVDGAGVSTTPDTRSLAALDVPFTIGAESQRGDFPTLGVVDEVAIYDKALASARVLAHYVAGVGN